MTFKLRRRRSLKVRPVLSVLTGMGVFENCSFFLELKNVLFKEKKKLKSAITENGGDICFLVNKQVR